VLNYKHYVRIRGSVIISVRERKFQGTKVPEDESFTYGTFVSVNESSRVRKFHESLAREWITEHKTRQFTAVTFYKVV